MFEKLRDFLKRQPEVGPEHSDRIKKLERIIGTQINNPFLFIRALRHRSTMGDGHHQTQGSYERLEFLGDAVLDLIVSEIIFDRFPSKNEGFLTKLRAQLVKGDALADFSQKLGLSELILIGERAQGQGIEFSKSALSDVFESLIGAIYIDKSYIDARNFVAEVIERFVEFEQIINSLDNYKSMLLEYAQSEKMAIPHYEVIAETGPDHNKTFEVRAIVDNKEFGQGQGKSKKEAEQNAARASLEKLGAL